MIVTLLALLLVRAALGLIAGRTGLIAAADLVTLLTWLALLVLLITPLLTLVLLALALLALTLLAGGGLVAARLTRLACFAAILLGLILLLAVLFVLRVRLIGLLRIVLRVCHGGLLFWNRPTELPAFLLAGKLCAYQSSFTALCPVLNT